MPIIKTLKAQITPSMRAWINRVQRPRIAHLPIRRLTPASRRYGNERGHPVDRYYIENFLAENRQCVCGACLEVRDDTYTRRFGGSAVGRADVLDIDTSNVKANIHGDLQQLTQVANETYDCVILTQVLQYIEQPAKAVAETHRILRPGGKLLLTAPGISAMDERATADLWRFTPHSIRRLLEQQFPKDQVVIRPYGNMLASVAMLMGLAQEDLRRSQLDHCDTSYSCVIAAQAAKPVAVASAAADMTAASAAAASV